MLKSFPEGAVRVSGMFNFVVLPPVFGSSARSDGISIRIPLSRTEATVLEAMLAKADQLGRGLELTISAGQQTIIQYRFKASGFQQARKTAIEAIAEVDARRRAGKCEDVLK